MKKKLKKNEVLFPFKEGEIVEGKVVKIEKSAAFLDLGAKGIGIIYGKEFYEARDALKELKPGDTTFAKVVELDNEQGYLELSLTQARQELLWRELQEKKDKGETLKVKIAGANKGGLLPKISGIMAFLPVSQLSSAHYPRVKDGDAAKILKALQEFVGQELEVKIFDISPKQKKLILSEKAIEIEQRTRLLENYKEGDVVEGTITNLTDFGAFMDFENGALEGLIHISELSDVVINDPSEVVKEGQAVKAKIIEISNRKVALSLKQLKVDASKN